MKKYKYNINNLDCANCAREVEEYLNSLDGFNNVIVNFNTSKLIFESDKVYDLNYINSLVKNVESDSFVTESKVDEKSEFNIYVFLIAIGIFIITLFPIPKLLKNILIIVAYVLFLYKIFLNSIKLLFKSHTINEYALITISCLGAYFIGEVYEGMMVIILYSIGKILENKAINKSRKSIECLIDTSQNYANVLVGEETCEVRVEDIKVGDVVVLKSGEKIFVDGKVVDGKSMIDTSSLTGESELVSVKKNDTILSGSINMGSVLKVECTSSYEDSTFYKILELLESATDKKTKTETMVAKFSKIYTPVIIILSILVIFVLPMFGISFKESIYRALTFLVISCPCAIAISVPLSYFTGIGVSSKNGILIKGSNYLDNLSNAKNIIFDKTGTITNGTFKVTEIDIKDNNYTEEEIIDILVKGESFSNHPIAKSILKLKKGKIDTKDVKNFKERVGFGISFDLKDKHISIGNKKMCNCSYSSTIHLNIDNKHVASIMIDDGIKDNVECVIHTLNNLKINTYMFTGDKASSASFIGKKVGIKNIYSEMLPNDKFCMYENVSESGVTIFVGDGVNDAPVLKRADIGISMGNIGSDSAIEASDIVILKDDLGKIITAYNISKFTKKIIYENLIFAIFIKILILTLSVFGLANMWFAVFADVGVTIITILNTLRIMRKKY